MYIIIIGKGLPDSHRKNRTSVIRLLPNFILWSFLHTLIKYLVTFIWSIVGYYLSITPETHMYYFDPFKRLYLHCVIIFLLLWSFNPVAWKALLTVWILEWIFPLPTQCGIGVVSCFKYFLVTKKRFLVTYMCNKPFQIYWVNLKIEIIPNYLFQKQLCEILEFGNFSGGNLWIRHYFSCIW